MNPTNPANEKLRNTALPISSRTIFVDACFVRAARGISAAKVAELVESGALQWVFNFGRFHGAKHIRHLRFWVSEILDPAAVAGQRLEQVISNILPPSRESFNGAEIGQWFLISPPTVGRIGREVGGRVKQRLLQVQREPLANFLRERWIGGGLN